MEDKYLKIREIVERELSDSAHDLEHITRVYNMCLLLAERYSDIDKDVLKTSALLHDIARVIEDNDSTGVVDHAVLGAEMSERILTKLGYDEEKIKKIIHCIASHRFRSDHRPHSREAQILFDADKLDILGAVGLARSYMIAGKYGERIYSDVDLDEYVRDNLLDGVPTGRIKDISLHAPNIEFENKIKNIPGGLFTDEAKKIALERVAFMEQFYKQLKKELECTI